MKTQTRFWFYSSTAPACSSEDSDALPSVPGLESNTTCALASLNQQTSLFMATSMALNKVREVLLYNLQCLWSISSRLTPKLMKSRPHYSLYYIAFSSDWPSFVQLVHYQLQLNQLLFQHLVDNLLNQFVHLFKLNPNNNLLILLISCSF